MDPLIEKAQELINDGLLDRLPAICSYFEMAGKYYRIADITKFPPYPSLVEFFPDAGLKGNLAQLRRNMGAVASERHRTNLRDVLKDIKIYCVINKIKFDL